MNERRKSLLGLDREAIEKEFVVCAVEVMCAAVMSSEEEPDLARVRDQLNATSSVYLQKFGVREFLGMRRRVFDSFVSREPNNERRQTNE